MSRDELQKIGEGLEAEIFAWEEGAILRLLRDPQAAEQNECQWAAMEAARSSGLRVPTVHGLTTVMNRPGMVMERLEGRDLMAEIGRRPWTVFRAARLSGEIHAQLHGVTAPDSVAALRPKLRQEIESSSLVPAALAKVALQALTGLPDGDKLCHGDFYPANLIISRDGPVLIDWTQVSRGDPAADVARTLLLVRVGELPPGTPILVRPIALVGRGLLASMYLRSYRHDRLLDMELVNRWWRPVVAARLAEGIGGERSRLLAAEGVPEV